MRTWEGSKEIPASFGRTSRQTWKLLVSQDDPGNGSGMTRSANTRDMDIRVLYGLTCRSTASSVNRVVAKGYEEDMTPGVACVSPSRARPAAVRGGRAASRSDVDASFMGDLRPASGAWGPERRRIQRLVSGPRPDRQGSWRLDAP